MAEILRLAQMVIDVADGDARKGDLHRGSPLAFALARRGVARWSLGREGWKDDLRRRHCDGPKHRPTTPGRSRWMDIQFRDTVRGARADDDTVRELDEALQIAEGSGDDYTLAGLKSAAGVALVLRDAVADRAART